MHATKSVIGFRLGVAAKLAAPRTEKHSKRDMDLKRALHELELYLRVRGWTNGYAVICGMRVRAQERRTVFDAGEWNVVHAG